MSHLLHQIICGGIAAAGFGVLFNFSFKRLPWCAICGALALGVRTTALDSQWSLEAASFAAALAVGCAVQLAPKRSGISRNTLAVAGCIPMVPGSFTTKAILALFALTAPMPHAANETLVIAVEYGLRVAFTIGAIGTGLAMPIFLLRVRAPESERRP